MTKPLRADAERNRQRLLAAARELFAEKGCTVGLDEIAHHAGVGVGTAYRRFPDKTELIDALFAERAEALIAAAEEALEEEDPWTGLECFMTRAVEMHTSDRFLKELVFGGAGGEDRMERVRGRIAPLVGELAQRAQDSGQLRRDVAPSDIALLQFMVAGLADFQAPAGLELWRRGLGIVLDGLRADAATPLSGRALTVEEVPATIGRRR